MRRRAGWYWSVARMFLGARGLLRTWQVGDGREEEAARAVLTSGGNVTVPKDAANGWAYAADMKSIALKGTACASAQQGTYTSITASYLCAP